MASTDSVPVPRARMSRGAGRATAVVLLAVWSAVALLPVFFTVVSALKSNSQILAHPLALPSSVTLGGFARAWHGTVFGEPAWRYGLNSVEAMTVGVLLGMAAGSGAAYALARNARRLFILNRYFVLLLTVPAVVTWIPLFDLVSNLRWLSDPLALGVVYAALIVPVVTVLMRAHFSSFPADLIEAAKVDGASEARAFFRVCLPLSVRAIAVVALLLAIVLWNELGLALILELDPRSQTIPVGIANLQGQYTTDYGAQYAMLVMAMIPTVIVYARLRRRVAEGMRMGGALK